MDLIDFSSCCRLCLVTGVKLISIFQESTSDLVKKHLQLQISNDDAMPKSICDGCHVVLKQFEQLCITTVESQKRLQKSLEQENSRKAKNQIEDDLADAVSEIGLIRDGNNLRSNLVNQDDDGVSEIESFRIGLFETDLEIDRILEMDQLDDIPDSNQIYTCEFCQPQPPFATLSELNAHLKAAHIDLVFHCETCDNFVDRKSLMPHFMAHLKEQEVVAAGKKKTVEEESEKEPEEEEEEPSSAESGKSDDKNQVSPIKEEFDDDLVDGKAAKHQMKIASLASGSNVKFLKKCHYCPKLFSNRSGRQYHQEQAHLKRRRFQCDKCDTSFGLKQTLINHIRNKHSNNVRNFHCDFPNCDKTYKTKSALHNHRIYHSKEPKYHCNYCSKKFHFNFLLQQHETTHLGTKPGKTFDCDVCKKSFNTRNKLTKHRGIHDPVQYSCSKEGCSFTGNLKRYLIAHIKRMHS